MWINTEKKNKIVGGTIGVRRGGVHGVPKKKKIVFAGNVTVCSKKQLRGSRCGQKTFVETRKQMFFWGTRCGAPNSSRA